MLVYQKEVSLSLKQEISFCYLIIYYINDEIDFTQLFKNIIKLKRQ